MSALPARFCRSLFSSRLAPYKESGARCSHLASLAILEAIVRKEDRAAAIGAWSGFAAPSRRPSTTDPIRCAIGT